MPWLSDQSAPYDAALHNIVTMTDLASMVITSMAAMTCSSLWETAALQIAPAARVVVPF